MTDSERNLGQQWFERVWNRGERAAIAEMLPPDAVIHDGELDTFGPDGFYPFFDRFHATFSNIHVEAQDTVAENGRICVRWSFTAKHTGDGLGFPATGKDVHTTGISIFRLDAGRLVEGWQNWDMLGLMEQIHGAPKSATYIGA